MAGDLGDLESTLDELVPPTLRRAGTPGLSLAVAHDGDTLCRAWGAHDVGTRRPMTARSLFPVGSMSKLYTAIAVLQLVERGDIGLHDPVGAHLGDVACVNPLGARPVTVYDLLTFRSGLAVDTPATSLGPPPRLADHVRAGLSGPRVREYGGAAPRWTARVGERYQYANLGISTLGLLVERCNPEHLSLAGWIRRHITEPLTMRRTWLTDWHDAAPQPDRCTGYACFGGLAVPSPELRSADFPADGVHTTPAEHVKLLAALMRGGDPILRPESVRLMLTPQVAMDGSDHVWPQEGWHTGLVAILTDLGSPRRRFGHPGAHTWGWWGSAWAYPALDCVVVVCANGWDMLGWHNPANREPTIVIADAVATFCGEPERPRPEPGTWAWKRSFMAGALMAERTAGTLGVASPLPPDSPAPGSVLGPDWDPDGYRAGLRAGADPPLTATRAAGALAACPGAPPPEQREALLQDLGMAYGCPMPLWMWQAAAPPSLLADGP